MQVSKIHTGKMRGVKEQQLPDAGRGRSFELEGIIRGEPTLTVFLLNQCSSMKRDFAGCGISMAEGAADALNILVQKAIMKCKLGKNEILDYFHILVIGYGLEEGIAQSILDESIVTLSWLSQNSINPELETGNSNDIRWNRAQTCFPTWVSPIANADAPLRKALESAFELLEYWVSKHQSAPPPNVINITNGIATDGDPTFIADKIKNLSTSNGNALLWNCHLTSTGTSPIAFPSGEEALPRQLKTFFRMSSLLSERILHSVMLEFPDISKPLRSRACVFNADLQTLLRFMTVATQISLP